jgi:hypothetical protein
MDQDFHYYGTYYAARTAGVATEPATRMATAANFIDFLSNSAYAGYWHLVTNTEPTDRDHYDRVARLSNPRYTFQGTLSTGVSPEDGLWCSYHFTPGNYDYGDLTPTGQTSEQIDNPSTEAVHGPAVAAVLPPFLRRDVADHVSPATGRLLNRPQSALSRSMLRDTIDCADLATGRLTEILGAALGGAALATDADVVERFRQLLIGIRAHVIADTWAHQDWAGISDRVNTYWDVNDRPGREAIDYDDGTTGGWANVVLSSTNVRTTNLQSAPSFSTIGHGWMGHFPDFSFAKFRYRPRWQAEDAEPLIRDNPEQYAGAFLELCSLFSQTGGNGHFNPTEHGDRLARAQAAIAAPCTVDDPTTCPRQLSSEAWLAQFPDDQPGTIIDAEQEPDDGAVLPGLVEAPGFPLSMTRYGDFYVNVRSDLYLFQIAADYHFHFVRNWLQRHDVLTYRGSWSMKDGPFERHAADELFAAAT